MDALSDCKEKKSVIKISEGVYRCGHKLTGKGIGSGKGRLLKRSSSYVVDQLQPKIVEVILNPQFMEQHGNISSRHIQTREKVMSDFTSMSGKRGVPIRGPRGQLVAAKSCSYLQ